MKTYYFNLWWRMGLSFFGAGLLTFAAESDPPWVVINDDYFVVDFAVAWLSAWIILGVQEYTVRWVDRLIPFRRRTRAYYIDRYTLQFFLSMLPTLLCAVCVAFLSVYVLMDTYLWDTYYFHYDVYIVGIAVLAIQVLLGFIHYIWSKDQFEEAVIVFDNSIQVYRRPDWTAPQRKLNGAVSSYLLENVEDQYPERGNTLAIGNADWKIGEKLLPLSNKDRRQWKVIQQLDWSGIAVFYSRGNLTYIVRWNGEEDVVDASLSNIKRLMDTELYFQHCKHMIVHYNAVIGLSKAGNGRVVLTLEPSVPVSTRLSRVATQEFRKWYLR